MKSLIETVFQNRTVNFSKLAAFGFSKQGNGYVYRSPLEEVGFQMEVFISQQGEVFARVTDLSTHEPYTLHLVKGSSGAFVGTVKTHYEQTLLQIANECFDKDVFRTKQAKAVIEHIRKTYDGELEFLWDKFPNNAIWRRNDNRKWYAALIMVSKRKLGLGSDEIAEILDLSAPPDELTKLIDHKTYFPGYHMNKNHWYTLLLDGKTPLETIYQRIEVSYQLAKGKPHSHER